MNDCQKDVLEFHKVMGLKYATKPQMLTTEAINRRIRLIEEELDEFVEAYEKDDILGMIDGLVDLLYVTYGAAVELGVDLEKFWAEIQRSNMTKIGGHLNRYGKYEKPDSYSPANLVPVYEKLYGKVRSK